MDETTEHGKRKIRRVKVPPDKPHKGLQLHFPAVGQHEEKPGEAKTTKVNKHWRDRIRSYRNPYTGKLEEKYFPPVLTDAAIWELNRGDMTPEEFEEQIDYISHVTYYAVELMWPDPDRYTVNLEGYIFEARYLRVNNEGNFAPLPRDYVAGQVNLTYAQVRLLEKNIVKKYETLRDRIKENYETLPALMLFHYKNMRKSGMVFSREFQRQLIQETKAARAKLFYREMTKQL